MSADGTYSTNTMPVAVDEVRAIIDDEDRLTGVLAIHLRGGPAAQAIHQTLAEGLRVRTGCPTTAQDARECLDVLADEMDLRSA